MRNSRELVWLVATVVVVAGLALLQASSGTAGAGRSDTRGRGLAATRGAGLTGSVGLADVQRQQRLAPSGEACDEVHVLTRRDLHRCDQDDGCPGTRILPNRRSGHAYGSRIVSLTKGSFLWKLGFRTDDIILSVQGRPTNDAEQGLQAFDIVRHDDVIVIELEREGRIKRLRIEFP